MCLVPRTRVRKPNAVAHICNPSTPTVRQQVKQENLPQVLQSTSLEYAARNRDPALETKRRRELTQESVPLTSLCTLWFGLGFYSLFVVHMFGGLTQRRVTWEERNPNLKIASIRFACKQFSGRDFLDAVGGPSSVWVEPTGQVVLGCIQNQGEQATASESVRDICLWPQLQFLPPGSCLSLCPVFLALFSVICKMR